MPPAKDLKSLTGRQKAAILLLSLGPDTASDIYRNLSDSEIEQITFEIANLGNITSELSLGVIEEFYHTAMAKQYINHGGISTAKDILEKALGPGKAMEVIERLQGILTGNPFDFLRHIDPANLVDFVRSEHPQTIALILSHLDHDQAALILSELPSEMQHEVVIRIASMDQTSPEIISDVERILEKKLASILAQDYTHTGGVDALAEVLNRLEQSSTKSIMQNLEDRHQDLAAEVKKRMFTFDDIVALDDRSLQKVLKHIDFKELAVALKGATDGVKAQIYGSISTRAAQDIQDEIEMMGPIRIKNVEESQQRIVSILRQLEETGEIELQRPGRADFID